MTTMYWIVGLVIGTPIAWFLLKILLSVVVSPERSGLALLNQELKARGKRVPDRALNEIVTRQIHVARGMAAISSFTGSEDKNWRANLARLLENDAAIIAALIEGGSEMNSPAYQKYSGHARSAWRFEAIVIADREVAVAAVAFLF